MSVGRGKRYDCAGVGGNNFPATSFNARFMVSTAVTMEKAVFWYLKAQFVPHRKHHVSATEPSRLILFKSWDFDDGDYEEYRLLVPKIPVLTSQETHYLSATEQIRLMLCKTWGFHGGDYVVFWNVTPCGSSKNRAFGRTCSLHLQDENNQHTRNMVGVTSNCSILRRISHYKSKALHCRRRYSQLNTRWMIWLD
jgi:hypothetical protein